jgi:voltage-gated potassium channel
MAYVAESPTNEEFDTFGDSLWWGIVTLTTVGYGDIVPITEKGRIAGTFLMLTGIATLGLIAGTLASAFGLSPADGPGPDAAAPTGGEASPDEHAPDGLIVAELRALRAQLDAIERQVAGSDRPGSDADG